MWKSTPTGVNRNWQRGGLLIRERQRSCRFESCHQCMKGDTMTQAELINLMTAIIMGHAGERLSPDAIGSKATLVVGRIRV